MRLRILDFGTVSALRSQAIFHGLAETITAESDPVLSLASPATPYVSVGMHQEIAREVDEDFCRDAGLPIYRRHVGGGAVYLDENQLFTHFIYPKDKAPKRAEQLYPMFIEPVVATYHELGIGAEFRPANDIHVKGRKIGGTGAASIAEATVMAGSFMRDFDTATMAKCLKVPSEKFRDKLKTTLDDYMTTMLKELGEIPPRELIVEKFLAQCTRLHKVEPYMDQPSGAELAAIAQSEIELVDPEWTFVQGRKFVEMGVKISSGTHLTQAMHKAPGGLIRVHLLDRDNKIADVLISGDFTCLPPDGVDRLAAHLVGTALVPEALSAAAEKGMADLNIEMPGVSGTDIASAIMGAVETST